jgi:hypothetical protein
VHAVEFPSEYLPDTHATGDVLLEAQLEPAGQSVMNQGRITRYIRFALHKKKQKNKERKVDKPGPVHVVELPSEYLPDKHVTGVALVVPQLLPAGQTVQTVVPDAVEYDPAGHGLGDDDATGQK